jgi:hypothetical protein
MFTLLTLGRSVLNQGIVVCLSAVGLGFVVNSLISAGVDAWLGDGVVSSDLTAWAIWAPFVLIFAVSLAFRSALLVPIETRANWVFRMTEHDATRSEVLAAAVHTMNLVGVIAPIAVMFPLQWLILGPPALVTAAVTMVWGMLLVEILMRGWTRIPFTCSYIPGKEFVPKTLLRLFVSYVLFTALGIGLVRSSLAGRPSALIPVAIVGTVMLGLRRRRLRAWRETPLAFEDSLPTEVNPLRLSV